MNRRRTLVTLLFALVACSSSTSPSLAFLDGEWSTGHQIIGLDMALNLTWSRTSVHGTGAYSAFGTGVSCGSTTIAASGAVQFSAARASGAQINGSIAFGGGTPVVYRGTLQDSTRIQGSLVAPDGTECPLEFFRGLVP
jgi:hypothetical protein